MGPSPVRAFQAELAASLAGLFGNDQVIKEWRSLSGEDAVYSPRIDVAVGPFATGAVQHAVDFDILLASHMPLIDRLIAHHIDNVKRMRSSDSLPSLEGITSRNPNARCFLAIEIENRCSRKHILGGLVNAAALGKIGIVVPWTPERLRAVLKMRRYLFFLASVGKNTFDPTNLLVLERNQVEQALSG